MSVFTADIDLRQQGDPLADEIFLCLLKDRQGYQLLERLRTNAEFSQMAKKDSVLQPLFLEVLEKNNLDRAILLKAQSFFSQYASVIFPILGFYSLPYCYAGARGVRALYTSQRIKNEPLQRLMYTAEFVLDICRPGAFDKDGKAYLAILKVRLQHAAARYYGQRYIQDEMPLNQEDMLGTLLSFSLIVLRGLQKAGIESVPADSQPYLELWFMVGAMLGILPQYLPNSLKRCSVLERQIRRKEFRKSEAGVDLTRILTDCLQSQGSLPLNLPAETLICYFLGEEIADLIGLKSRISAELLKPSLFLVNAFKTYSDFQFVRFLKDFENMKASITHQ